MCYQFGPSGTSAVNQGTARRKRCRAPEFQMVETTRRLVTSPPICDGAHDQPFPAMPVPAGRRAFLLFPLRPALNYTTWICLKKSASLEWDAWDQTWRGGSRIAATKSRSYMMPTPQWETPS